MPQLSFVIISAKAQDTLITHNNDTLLVTIVEVTEGSGFPEEARE